MAQAWGTLGTRAYISSVSAATTVDTEVEYFARTFNEIGFVENFGEFGKMFDMVPFQAVGDGRTYKLKGGYNSGQMTLVVGADESDAGQFVLYTAANLSTQDLYVFRIELTDKVQDYASGTVFYFLGLVMSWRENLGAVNNAIRATSVVEIASDLLMLPPAELFSHFDNNLDSLAQFNLFHGSDAEASSPSINNGLMVLTSGNVGSGFAADGSEAVGGDALVFTAAGGTTLILDATVKCSTSITGAFFVGFTDNNLSLEMPIEAPSGTLVTNASDAVGFLMDSGYGNGQIRLVGVNNNVDETTQNPAGAAIAGAFIHLRLEIAANGDTTFYRNGVAYGTVMTTALGTGVNIYPVIAWTSRTTSSINLVVDKWYVRQD